MKINKIFCILFLVVATKKVSAQSEYPLTYSRLQVQSGDYIKDTNNELPKFTGQWIATLSDKKVTLNITTALHEPERSRGVNFFVDCLLIRYKVTTLDGTVLQETLTKDFNLDKHLRIISSAYQASEDMALLVSYPNACRVGAGIIFLKWLGQNSLEWEYQPMTAQISDQDCWNHQERLKIYLPTNQKVIFTRQ